MADREPIGPRDGATDDPRPGDRPAARAVGTGAGSERPAPAAADNDTPRFRPNAADVATTDPGNPAPAAGRLDGVGDNAVEPPPPGGDDGPGLSGEPSPAPAASSAGDIAPRRLHPAGIAIGAIRRLRGFAVPLIVLLLTRDPREAGTLALVLLATLAAVGWQAVEWATTRWSVEGNRLRLSSGVLGRRERLVPLERVQAVDLSDTPLERALGVTGVRVETAAGGSDGGVVLEAVGRGEAEALRARLLALRDARHGVADGARTTASSANPAPGSATAALPSFAHATTAGEPPLYRMGWREVLLAGATSGRIGPAMAVLGFGIGLLDDLADLPLAGRLTDWMPFAGERGLGTVAVALVAGALLAWLLAIGGAALTWSGFELRVEGDRVLLAHGLLDRRRRSVPLARIQALSVRESLLRRPFGLAEVRFESAGRGADATDSGVLLPLVRAEAAPALLARIAPTLAPPPSLPALSRPPARARSRFIGGAIRPVVVLVLAGVAAAAVIPGIAWWWGLALLVGVPLAILHGELAWRDSGWAIDGDRLLLRNGGLERRLTLAPRRRLQRRGTVQSPLARRADLATFRADVPSGGEGGRLRAPFLDESDAARLVVLLRG